jgi:membrane-bound serine protease (ClpP class)
MVFGALLLVEGPPEMRIRLSTALGVTLPFTGITVFLVSIVIRARLRPAAGGAAGLLTETGVAVSDLAPAGTVRVHGELWSAVASTPASRGARVRIVAVDGLRLRVEPESTSGERE